MKYVFKNKLYVSLVWAFDLLGNILFLIFLKRLLRQPRRTSGLPRNNKQINNILLIRLDHIGDVIYSTGLPQNLKQYYPNAKIAFLTANATKEILTNNPYVDKVICYDAPWFKRAGTLAAAGFSLRRKTQAKACGYLKFFLELKGFFKLAKELRKDKYDLGIDLRGDIRHIILMVLAKVKFKIGFGITGGGFLLEQEAIYRKNCPPVEHNLDLLKSIGINPVSAEPQFYVNEDTIDSANKFLKENNLDKNRDFITIIHPHAGYNSKNWKDDRFAELMNTLTNRYNAKLILTGSQENKANIDNIISLSQVQAINAAGKTSLQSLFALIRESTLFIGVDSGPSHIASLSNKPTVILYSGTNKKEEWAPKARGNSIYIIQKDVPCGNCGRLNCDKHICMDLISVADVLNEIEKAVKQ